MKGLISGFVAAVFWIAPAWSADWEQLVTAEPGYFPLPQPVRLSYRIGWSGIPAGEATVIFHSAKDGRVEVEATGRSIGAARALWRLDAWHKAVAAQETLKPVQVEQFEDYGWKNVTTRLDFESDAVWRFRHTKPDEPRPPPCKRVKMPQVRDMHTAFLFVRSQRCAPGDHYHVVVFAATSGYLVDVQVLRQEPVAVRAGKFQAIKCELKIRRIGKKRNLEPFTRCRKAYVWLSNDASRFPVKIVGELFIGTVFAELQSVRPLRR